MLKRASTLMRRVVLMRYVVRITNVFSFSILLPYPYHNYLVCTLINTPREAVSYCIYICIPKLSVHLNVDLM